MAIITDIRHIKEWAASSPQLQYRPVRLMGRVIQGMATRDYSHLAAGVAYYAIFSLFPFLLGSLAIAGMVLDSPEMRQQFIKFISASLPGSAGFLESNLNQIVKLRGTLGVIAIIGLLWSSTSVFVAISRVVNRVWRIDQDRPFYISKPRQIVMGIMVGILFLAYTVANSTIYLILQWDLGIPGQALFQELGLAR
jgi:membrane protein